VATSESERFHTGILAEAVEFLIHAGAGILSTQRDIEDASEFE
jgi:hypothetical protein